MAGATRFLNDGWPRVRAAVPNARLRIAGKAPPAGLIEAAHAAGAELAANVPSMPEEMARHVMVVPLWSGAGARVKIMEAMAARLPVITTPLGAEGLGLEPGRHYIEGASAGISATSRARSSAIRSGAPRSRVKDARTRRGSGRKPPSRGCRTSWWGRSRDERVDLLFILSAAVSAWVNAVGRLRGSSDPRRILVVKLDHLGDVILATPALHALRERYPGAEIDVLVHPASVVAVAHHPAVSPGPHLPGRLASREAGRPDDASRLREIARTRYDTVVELRGDSRTLLLPFWAGPTARRSRHRPAPEQASAGIRSRAYAPRGRDQPRRRATARGSARVAPPDRGGSRR